MHRISDRLRRLDVFDQLSLGLILLLTGIALAYWSKYPVHMDTFYHMGATSGYARAGGVALTSFWEYAPVGRAQLYPPLLHVMMFALTKTGLSTLSAGRAVAFFAWPLLLLSNWYGMRKLFTNRAAFYTIVIMSSCYLLFWHSAVESAASLVLILTPLIFVAVERDRKVAAAVLLAMALYSHLVLGHLVAFGLLLYAVHRRQMFKEIAIVLVGAYVLWLPYGVHLLVNYRYLGFSDPVGGGGGVAVTLHLLVWLAALAGLVLCYFKKKTYYLLPSFLLGLLPIVFFYPDRFWSAHSFVPLAMLGGVALSSAHGLVKKTAKGVLTSTAWRKAVVVAVMSLPVALFLLADPVLAFNSGSGAQMRPPGVQQTPRQGLTQQPGIGQQGSGGLAGQRQGPLLPRRLYAQGSAGLPAVPRGVGALPAAPPAAPGQGPGGQGVQGVQGPPGQGTQNGGGQAQGPPGIQGGPGGPGGGGAPAGPRGQSSSTTLLSLLGGGSAGGRQSLEASTLIGADTLKLAELIKANSAEDQIVYCPDGSLGNLITGLTGRSSTGGMFHEVKAYGDTADLSKSSYLLVIPAQSTATGIGAGQGPNARSASIDTSKYTLAGTAGTYNVYKNASVAATSHKTGLVIPWAVVFSILGIALLAVCVDWFRHGPGPDYDPPGRQVDGTGTREPTSAAQARKEVLAIVPCYNEGRNVGSVIAELRSFAPFADILVVDDGSTDGTAFVALQSGALVISHGRNRGIGAAVRTGMSYALASGYRYALQVDGDGQHDARFARSLLAPLQHGASDLVVGSRFLGAGHYQPSAGRRAGIRLLAWVVSKTCGRRATDTTSGFRAMNRNALAFLVANYPDDFGETESLVQMSRAGIRWTEVPAAMRERVNGHSSISGLVPACFMFNVLARIALDLMGIRALRPPIYA
jgi:hypothetical protein